MFEIFEIYNMSAYNITVEDRYVLMLYQPRHNHILKYRNCKEWAQVPVQPTSQTNRV